MANPEHLEILKQGVKKWNRWREARPDIRPDLSKADLKRADLSGANLSGADFNGAKLMLANLSGADLNLTYLGWADFSRADLGGADLSKANLIHADLNGADLSRAYLRSTDLRVANLRVANLRVANLSWTNLSGANLDGADLDGAMVESTIFSDNDLSTVQGLDNVEHRGPSTIGIDTIYKSGGTIPEVFLRGCGVPESFITFHKSLVNNPIEFYSCFISYSHADKSFARRLHDQLQARGIRCWLDEHQMLPGDKIFDAVDQRIRLWDKVLLCASASSLGFVQK
jgi:TIR domain/Pentapeptide repeats (8 copies)